MENLINIKLSLMRKMTEPNAANMMHTILDRIMSEDEAFEINYIQDSDNVENQMVEEISVMFKTREMADEFLNIVNDPESEFSEKMCTSDYVLIGGQSNACVNETTINETPSTESDNNTFTEDLSNKNYSLMTSTYLEKEDTLRHTDSSLRNSDSNLEFYFNRPINVDDEDAIIMFLENRKASGGGDIDQFELDPRKKMLMVKYCSDALKRRVLSKRHFRFQDYTFSANEPFDSLVFPQDLKTLILQKFKFNEDKENVRLFAENLVSTGDETEEENDVEFVQQSNLFKECFFIRFKNDFQMDRVVSQLKRRPTLHGQRIEALPAILSNTCVIITPPRTEKRDKISTEVMELYFTNKKRSGVASYEHLYNMDNYTLIRFDTEANARKLLEKRHTISNQEVICEYLYNLDMLKSYKPDVTISAVQNTSLLIPTQVPVFSNNKINREHSEDNKINEILKKLPDLVLEDEIVQKIRLDQLVLIVDLSMEPNAKCLSLWDCLERLGEDLNSLVDLNLGENTLKVQYNKVIDQNMSEDEYNCLNKNWQQEMLGRVREFFGQFKKEIFQCEDMLIREFLRTERNLNIEDLQDGTIEIFGKSDPVEKVLQQIEALTQKVVTEEMNDLNLTQIRMLYVNKYISSMKTKFPELEIKINIKLVQVKITGKQRQVDEARNTIRSIMSKMKMKARSFEPTMLTFFSEKEKFFVDLIKARDLQCVLEITNNLLNVHSTSEEKINEFLSIVEDDLKVVEFDLTIVDDLPKLKDLCESMEKQPDLMYTVEDEVIRLYGFGETCDYFYNQLICI